MRGYLYIATKFCCVTQKVSSFKMASNQYTQVGEKTTLRPVGTQIVVGRSAICRYNYAMHCFYWTHFKSNNIDQYKGKFLPFIKTFYFDSFRDVTIVSTIYSKLFYLIDWLLSIYLIVVIGLAWCMLHFYLFCI